MLSIAKPFSGLIEKRKEVLRKRKEITEKGHRSAVNIVAERLKSDEGFSGFIRGELNRSNELVDTRRSLELDILDTVSGSGSGPGRSSGEPKLIK